MSAFAEDDTLDNFGDEEDEVEDLTVDDVFFEPPPGPSVWAGSSMPAADATGTETRFLAVNPRTVNYTKEGKVTKPRNDSIARVQWRPPASFLIVFQNVCPHDTRSRKRWRENRTCIEVEGQNRRNFCRARGALK
jgi:hypothetical protein